MLRLRWPDDADGILLDRARTLRDLPGRAVLGLAGPPGAGKSTLTAALTERLAAESPRGVAVVGMDAFHLGGAVLERHGLTPVKGAPHTFDAAGYVALLHRLRSEPGTVYAPEFHREIEESLAHVVEVGPEVGLVITEGNYLLLPDPPWDAVRPLLDEVWYVHLEAAERHRRMVERHRLFGRTEAEARDRTMGSDEANARLVEAARERVRGTPAEPDVDVEHG